LRSLQPPCPWGDACRGAVGEEQWEVLSWLRAQDPPCPCDADLSGLVVVHFGKQIALSRFGVEVAEYV